MFYHRTYTSVCHTLAQAHCVLSIYQYPTSDIRQYHAFWLDVVIRCCRQRFYHDLLAKCVLCYRPCRNNTFPIFRFTLMMKRCTFHLSPFVHSFMWCFMDDFHFVCIGDQSASGRLVQIGIFQ